MQDLTPETPVAQQSIHILMRCKTPMPVLLPLECRTCLADCRIIAVGILNELRVARVKVDATFVGFKHYHLYTPPHSSFHEIPQMQNSRPGEFIALVALLTAMVAMSIDTMLPAIGEMAAELGALNPNDRQLIILGFFAGMMGGTLLFGPLSDSIGRKPAIFMGLVLFVIGALVCMMSTSFAMLIAGRALQGFGAASPRIVSIAMVRDGVAGAAMARIMSFVMSVFMLVPILAPSIGQLVLNVASWRYIFGGFIVMAGLCALWLAFRQEETLDPGRRLPYSVGKLLASAGEVIRNPVALGYTIAVGSVFGAFTAYLGTSQQIFAEQYAQGRYFALWFGGLAVAIAVAMIFNGKVVMRLGMQKITRFAVIGFIATWVIVLVFDLFTAGHPPLPVVGVLFFVSFFCSGLLFGNYNAMAMEPMGHIAGMASAISGALSTFIAVVFGAIAGHFYDGTLYPITIAFLIYGVLAYVAARWAERGRTRIHKSSP
jgi:DHA1 family bicyclomycin/chloramphenicol resistance-like MFS transporter